MTAAELHVRPVIAALTLDHSEPEANNSQKELLGVGKHAASRGYLGRLLSF